MLRGFFKMLRGFSKMLRGFLEMLRGLFLFCGAFHKISGDFFYSAGIKTTSRFFTFLISGQPRRVCFTHVYFARMSLLHLSLLQPSLARRRVSLDVLASTVASASTWSLHRLYQLQLRYFTSTRCFTAVIARSILASASTLTPSQRQLDVCSQFRQSSSLGSHLFHYFNDLELLKQHSLPVCALRRYLQ